ncbi:phage tail length tape measure family protein [Luteimonas sp. JM171]|uniref:phage tail length tape measure family protein n=1 Tax=Luteimonas sp. JM171 TaxID=1896164 RepID=UPI00085825A6|nr:phage tail length tape measure family protein [Luteimonas sp. JM171]AOH36880.1 hypothetical protein BGP89_11375 [Luteimonas sp. JM171]
MSSKSVRFNIDLTANPDAARRLSAALSKVGRDGQKSARDIDRGFASVSNRLGSLRGLLASLGGAMLFRQMIQNTIRQENAMRQLEARLQSTGHAAGLTHKELVDMAAGFQQVTTFGDEAVIEGQALMLTFTNIGREVFPQALEAALNLSTGMGTDLTSAVRLVGRALHDPVRGLTQLSRVGVTLSKEQETLVRRLVETGRHAEAQGIILGELETKFGGAARAARDTFGGALEALKNAFGDLLEGDSGGDGIRGAKTAVESLTETLNDPAVKTGFAAMVSGAVRAAQKVAELIAMLVDLRRYVDDYFSDGNERTDRGLIDERMRIAERLHQHQNPTGARRVGQMLGLPDLSGFDAEAAQARIDEIDRELARRRNAGRFANVTGGVGPVPRPSAGGSEDEDEDEDDKGKGKGKGTGSAGTRDLFGPQEEALKRQLALLGANSEAAKVLYEVQHGSLVGLEPAQKIRLVDLAQELDLAKDRIDEIAREAAERKEMEAEALALKESLYTAEERYGKLVDRINELHAARLLTDEERFKALEAAAQRLAEETGKAGDQFEEFGLQAARNLQTAFADFLFDPFEDGLSGMLRGFTDVVRRMVSEALAAQLLKSLFGGAAGAADGKEGGWWSMVRGFLGSFGGGSAKGNVFSAGAMVPFANGGIVKGPITFPMANGQFGLMGEAGPEAIMPLRRGPGGRLGVDASAGGRAPEVNIRQITVLDPAELAGYLFSAQNERVIVQYLDRLGFGARN